MGHDSVDVDLFLSSENTNSLLFERNKKFNLIKIIVYYYCKNNQEKFFNEDETNFLLVLSKLMKML